MWRVLDNSIEVSTVFQINWFLPYWQMHGGIEEKHPVVTCPHYTPAEERERCIYTSNRLHSHYVTKQHQSDPGRWFWVTIDSWEPLRQDEFGRLIQILMYFCLHLTFFHNHSSAGSQDFQMDKSTICPASSIYKPIMHLSFVINPKVTNFLDVPV